MKISKLEAVGTIVDNNELEAVIYTDNDRNHIFFRTEKLSMEEIINLINSKNEKATEKIIHNTN